MTKTLTKSRLRFNKLEAKSKLEESTSILSTNLKIFEERLLAGNDFIAYKCELKVSN